jgi:Tol biopolymer transport system component
MRRTREPTGKDQLAMVMTAACGVALSTGLIPALIYLLLALAPLVALRPGFGQSAPPSAGMRLQAGIEKEDVDGDLKSAMDIYQKIAANNSVPREVRARALLRLAGCEEKLGRQAKQFYEQIVRDYADEPAAAQARNRLALIRQQEHPPPPTAMTARKIEWASGVSLGPTDTDGERAVFWSADHLYFGDLAGRSWHLIGDFKYFGWVPSKDLSIVLLDLLATADRPHILAVIKTDGTGYRELIRDDAKNSIFGINASFSMNWSWDDKYVVLSDFSPQSTLLGQVWIVSVADGHRRALAESNDSHVRKAVFSPNGQFLAYEAHPRNGQLEQTSRVFVVPVHGGEPRLVFESASWKVGGSVMSLMDWTADGRYLAVHDVRQGRSALYLLPIKNGAANGEAAFVRYGEFDEGYSTSAGGLVVQDNTVRPGNSNVSVATIDPSGHLGDWRDLDLNGPGNVWPSFSPDGSQVAYTGLAVDPTPRNLVLLDLATGRKREIYASAYPSLACQYSIHNPRVFCSVEKEKGESELFSVEVESGAVEHIATFPQSRFLLRSGWDDQTFYFSLNGWRFGPMEPPILEWNRSTNQEIVITQDGEHFQMPSPDGRSIVRLRDGILSVRPVSGGDWMPLVSGIGMRTSPFATPDGKWVFYQNLDAARKIGLFRVPIAGGDPQRLGDPPGSRYSGNYFFSPDGRQILTIGAIAKDLWLLENFLPSQKK